MTIVNGRGAWSKVGKSNGSVYYEYVAGKPADGSEATRSLDHLAVNSAVKAIQTELNSRGQKLVVDGQFGPRSGDAAKAVQKLLGLTADGKIGPGTCKTLFHNVLVSSTGSYAALVYGLAAHESSFDPGARGFVNAPDSGLVQINLNVHEEITWDEAFTPAYAFRYAANHLADMFTKYALKPSLQLVCAVASHNSPVWADQWFRNGVAPNTTIQEYVSSVVSFSQEFK